MKPRAHAYWAVLLSFALAAWLQIIPLPTWAQWWRPQWVVLAMVYWVIALPHRVGLLTAVIVGIACDVLAGAVLGQSALGLVLVAYIAVLLYQRLRLFVLWQQAAVVFMLVALYQLSGYWVQSLTGRAPPWPWFLLPVISSAIAWPLIFLGLRSLRRRFGVV